VPLGIIRKESSMNKILVLFAHPALEKSRVNKVILEQIQRIEDLTFHDLYEQYPDFDIDITREQALLTAHNVIALHHPFFWYSTPAILKEWQDLVLTHGWAYGKEGTALHGKILFNLVTTGGKESAYRKEGLNRFTMRQLLAPIEQTARLCGMDYLPPFVIHGTHRLTDADIEKNAEDCRRFLEAFRDDRINLDIVSDLSRMNQELDRIIR
jgi:glutathione-regulated potassium-efflux system ancillary protein KefG